jgi:hypothetical protein
MKDFGATELLVAFAPFAIWSPHFETELEIIQNHLDKGGRAIVLSCSGQLNVCEPNPEHDLNICAMCKSRFRSGMRWLDGAKVLQESFYCLTHEQESIVQSLGCRTWRDIEEVRSYAIDGADIGLAAVSSVVSFVRDSEPNIDKYQEIIRKHVVTAAMIYFSIKNKLAEKKADGLLIFNGRFSSLRPALRAAQQLGIQSYVHERAGERDRFSVTENTYPHDLNAIKAEIEKVYFQSLLPEEKKHELAFGWYEERRAGIDQSWHSFTKHQKPNLLPEEFKPDAINVVIFNSSEDEFVAIEEWNNPYYKNQNKAIAQLMEDIAGESRIRIFLRVHPNLKGISNTQTEGIDVLAHKYKSIHLIHAESPVSTYALIDAADVVVTYGSTIGAEATYVGKLSILMGRATYEDLDVCIRPRSHEEFIKVLRDIAIDKTYPLPSGYKIGLVKYGLFKRLWGERFKYVKPNGLFSAKMVRGIKIVTINPNIMTRIMLRLRGIFRSTKLRIKKY